jgi:transposase
MKNLSIIGIDVSKLVLDVFILSCKFHFQVENSPAGFAQLLETCCSKLNTPREQLYFCFENTGRYSRMLSVFLDQSEIIFSQIPALDIKASKGISRGKTDKADARDIALYAWRKKDELEPTKLQTAQTSELRQLVALRDKLIKHRTAYKNSIKDLQDCYYEGETEFIKDTQVKMINQLNEEIKNIEDRMDQIINSMPEWKRNFKLIKSIRGVGPVISRYVIIYTENFTRFTKYKKFACYAGIAPFEYASGSSIKGRTRVHPCANKQLKSLLNLAAMNAIKINGEYKQYYLRRQQEGKNNMSTLNIIRNKILARIFAVVKRQTPYVDLYKFAA